VLRHFEELMTRAKQSGPVKVVVAAAQDEEALWAVKAAQNAGLADVILVGDLELITPMRKIVGLAEDTQVVHEPDVANSALIAASIVKGTQSGILMKGLVNSSDFLRAVLNSEHGLRTGRLLSHFAAFEAPDGEKLTYHTDGGMNILPNLQEKKEILVNALIALSALGIDRPTVAIRAANEVVNPKMPATVDAKELVEMSRRGELPQAVLEGPISMDVALSPIAAAHKGLATQVAGRVDLFLVPDIASGNILAKALIHYAKFKNAGVILGATHPVVMVSRADSAESKLRSIALACCIASGKGGG
jgi:phosphate butyryltransferase